MKLLTASLNPFTVPYTNKAIQSRMCGVAEFRLALAILVRHLVILYLFICFCFLSSLSLSGRIGKLVVLCLRFQGRFPVEAAPIYTVHEGAQGLLPMRVWGATSQLDLPSLTPLSVASCCRMQLEVSIGLV